MRLVARLTVCFMPILTNAAQTAPKLRLTLKGVNRSADFYPDTGAPAKAGINSDLAIVEKLTAA